MKKTTTQTTTKVKEENSAATVFRFAFAHNQTP